MAHATPNTADLAIQIGIVLGLLICAITAAAGRRILADTAAAYLALALAALMFANGDNGMTWLTAGLGLAACCRVLRALWTGRGVTR
ncbi:hypothetical protein [Actinomadura sp. GTD37]|uniref:hypothetical protein n=1 Tax=Actinomadura sp. GTD37 TaxID=1778030 RepID=UPI0035C26D58